MTIFQEREQAFEAAFAHEEEFRFLVTARRDRLFAEWAAAKLHLPSETRTELVASVLRVHDGAVHDKALVSEMKEAFQKHGIAAIDSELTIALRDFEELARQQLLRLPV